MNHPPNFVLHCPAGAHCDIIPWQGWVFAHYLSDLSQAWAFTSEPGDKGDSGIWMQVWSVHVAAPSSH